MPIETPDVLVVGLGPAGSRAAATAAAAGLGVVALERRRAAGTPVQCAEFVPAVIERDVPGVRAVTAQKVARMLTFVAGGTPEVTEDFRGLMIDRAAFDRMLAQEAALNGAECRYGETVWSIDADGTVQTSAGTRLRPRVLIGADGPRSQVGAGDRADQPRPRRHAASHRAVGPAARCDRHFSERRLLWRLRLAVSQGRRSPMSVLASPSRPAGGSSPCSLRSATSLRTNAASAPGRWR